ncbi:MAG: alpha-glucosidase C-terminal domain-containing protein [Anaerolineae bacterium]|nr:alpha-glucosidase C-terminal domain-containing protein [Anaerolineae bacterium]
MTHWAYDAVFYHIYPLGFCGAPAHNDFCAPPTPRLEQLYAWIDHLHTLEVNALYLGPLFESSRHGYDTADYYHVDRRLGANETLSRLVSVLHDNGIRVILDGVFNHVGRDFWAFRDVLQHHEHSVYGDWFRGLSFNGRSPYGDPFTYEGWNGHYDLVTLNLDNPAVTSHLFRAIEMWIEVFNIDGLRLDVADCLDKPFMRALRAFCQARNPDFWLMGEVIHGDYRQWVNVDTLHAVTNYECYKGLYSSLVDKNYFEIAYALRRQFGEEGLYRHLPLYNFADNHDVDRVASSLQNPAHLYPLYCLLFTMPGVPSIYYGSEWGMAGKKDNGSDTALRPYLDLATMIQTGPHPELVGTLEKLSRIRHTSPALKYGEYRQVYVNHEQLAFARYTSEEAILVVLNAAEQPVSLTLDAPFRNGTSLTDLLKPGETFPIHNGKVHLDSVWPHWARILRLS